MGTTLDEAQAVLELFRAHYTVQEIVERTGIKTETVVKIINAPRVMKGRDVTAKVA